jgi:hypothetical protein
MYYERVPAHLLAGSKSLRQLHAHRLLLVAIVGR